MYYHPVRHKRYFPSIDYVPIFFGQDRILFLTFVVARGAGVNAIQRAFPKVKIITGAIDDDLSERWLTALGDALDGAMGRKVWIIEPGLGNIGGSFVCTGLFSH